MKRAEKAELCFHPAEATTPEPVWAALLDGGRPAPSGDEQGGRLAPSGAGEGWGGRRHRVEEQRGVAGAIG
jgi:hypothetical protein